MSNKTQLQNNNTALDGYIARINAAKDTAASLPDAGGGGGGNSNGTISVIVNNNTSANEVYYWDADKTLQSVGAGTSSTVNAFNGVLYCIQEVTVQCSGNYLQGMARGVAIVIFLSDGGVLNCTGGMYD